MTILEAVMHMFVEIYFFACILVKDVSTDLGETSLQLPIQLLQYASFHARRRSAENVHLHSFEYLKCMEDIVRLYR